MKQLPNLKKLTKEQATKLQSRINEKDEIEGPLLSSPEYLEYPPSSAPGNFPYYQYAQDLKGINNEDDSVVIDAKFGNENQQNSLEGM